MAWYGMASHFMEHGIIKALFTVLFYASVSLDWLEE